MFMPGRLPPTHPQTGRSTTRVRKFCFNRAEQNYWNHCCRTWWVFVNRCYCRKMGKYLSKPARLGWTNIDYRFLQLLACANFDFVLILREKKNLFKLLLYYLVDIVSITYLVLLCHWWWVLRRSKALKFEQNCVFIWRCFFSPWCSFLLSNYDFLKISQ